MQDKNIIVIWAVCAIAIMAINRSNAASGDYIPGLGEFMAATQMRHSKLWFAGQARNWELAAYELEEIREGFEDITRFHPVHKDSPVPITEILPDVTVGPLRGLETAVNSENFDAFEKAFDSLTAACNECHRAENFAFNIIIRPGANPYTNQEFSPEQAEPVSNHHEPGKEKNRMAGGAAH